MIRIEVKNYDSPSREVFEKLIKTIEDQGQKQIKAIQDQEQVKEIKKYTYDAEHTALISRQKEIFNERLERLEKVTDLDKIVNSDDLNTADAKFDKFDTALDTINKIKYAEVSLADAKKNNQQKLKSYLEEIKKGNNKRRSKEQKTALHNIECFIKQEMKLLNVMMIILQ